MNTIQKIELESRWDGFNIPIEDLPDGPILFNGKDAWFLTNKKHLKDVDNLYKWYDDAMMYGIKEADKIKESNNKNMENNTNWEIVGDHQAPPIFQVEGTTIDARTSSIEVRGWNTMDLVSFGNYMVSQQREDLITEHPELITPEDKEAAYHQVSDADLSNWRFLVGQTAATLQADVQGDDEDIYPSSFFDNNLEARAEQSRT